MVIVEEKRMNLYGWKRAGGGYRPDGRTVSCRPVSLVTIPIQVILKDSQVV